MDEYTINIRTAIYEELSIRKAYFDGLMKYSIWADYISNGSDIYDMYEKELTLLNYLLKEYDEFIIVKDEPKQK